MVIIFMHKSLNINYNAHSMEMRRTMIMKYQ